jgi:hypothetical protein
MEWSAVDETAPTVTAPPAFGGPGPVDIHRRHIIAPTNKSMDRYDRSVFS